MNKPKNPTEYQIKFAVDLRIKWEESGMSQEAFALKYLKIPGPYFNQILTGKRYSDLIIYKYGPGAGLDPKNYIPQRNYPTADNAFSPAALQEWPYLSNLVLACNNLDHKLFEVLIKHICNEVCEKKDL